MSQSCSVTPGRLGGLETIRLENDLVAVMLLVNKGADIYELRYKPRDIDVLWKAPWGVRDPRASLPTASSLVAWLDAYSGGWQVLFPSGGGPSAHKGAELVFHGEASLDPWTVVDQTADEQRASVRLIVRLARSPFSLEREVSLRTGSPIVTIRERITNHGAEPMEYMWTHHPAFGAPFLSEHCRIQTGARSVSADEADDGLGNPMTPGGSYQWPAVEGPHGAVDLGVVPAEGPPRTLLAYLSDFEAGWFAITSTEMGFGVGVSWPRDLFPYAWMWQEMRSSPGYPWYGGAYVLAIEPSTSFPGQGLAKVIETTGTHRTLGPGESEELTLLATFFEGSEPVTTIDADGSVRRA